MCILCSVLVALEAVEVIRMSLLQLGVYFKLVYTYVRLTQFCKDTYTYESNMVFTTDV